MFEQGDEILYPFARAGAGQRNAPPGSAPIFAGMPPAILMHTQWCVREFDFTDPLARAKFSTAATPPATGTEWTVTQLSANNGTSSYPSTAWPMVYRLATAATADGDGINTQMNVVGAGWNLQSAGLLQEAFMSVTMLVDDITQSEFFLGFAPTDTNVLSTVDDFIGIAKNDDSTLVKGVASGTSVASPHVAGTIGTIGDLAKLDSTGNASAVSKFVTYCIRIIQKKAYFGVFTDREVSAGRRAPAHRLTLDLPNMGAVSTPTIALASGSAAVRTFDIAKIVVAGRYALGGKAHV